MTGQEAKSSTEAERVTMTIDEVQSRVAKIEAAAAEDNDPYAHGLEDELHLDLLKSIAHGTCEGPVACALVAIKTEEIAFARWME